MSRNSGTRRIREDTNGHEQAANQVQEDTEGTARIQKDRPLPRFGTVRPRVQIPGPRPDFELRVAHVSGVNVTVPLYWCSTHVAHLPKSHRNVPVAVDGSPLHANG